MIRRLIILLLIVGCGTEPEKIYGCTNPEALNYDETATIDDNCCELIATCMADEEVDTCDEAFDYFCAKTYEAADCLVGNIFVDLWCMSKFWDARSCYEDSCPCSPLDDLLPCPSLPE